MPATAALRLTASQYSRLTRLRRRTRWRRVSDRATALLLLSEGQAVGSVARVMGVTRGTIFNWKRRWLGGQPLSDRPHPGARPKAAPEYRRLLVRTALGDPRRHGYAFTRWTAGRLSEYLARRTGVRISPKWVRVLLRRHGIVWRRTKRTTRNLQDPVAFRRAHGAIRRLKRGCLSQVPRTNSGSGMASASTFSLSRRACTGVAGRPRRFPRRARISAWAFGGPCAGRMDPSSSPTEKGRSSRSSSSGPSRSSGPARSTPTGKLSWSGTTDPRRHPMPAAPRSKRSAPKS